MASSIHESPARMGCHGNQVVSSEQSRSMNTFQRLSYCLRLLLTETCEYGTSFSSHNSKQNPVLIAMWMSG